MRRVPVTLAALLALGACQRSRPSSGVSPEPALRTPEAPTAPASSAVPGDLPQALPPWLAIGPRQILFAVYLPAPVSPAQQADARDAVRRHLPGIAIHAERGTESPAAFVLVPPMKDFAPPTLESLRYFARGLDEAQKKTASASQGVLLVSLVLDKDADLAGLRGAMAAVEELARKLGGFVWDEQTRELYTPDEWHAQRIDGWEAGLPDMRKHIVIHYYETDGERHRAITLGMEKFGLPDLVVADVPLSSAGAMTTVLDAVAQVLVEGATLAPPGDLALDLTAIRDAKAHDALIGGAGPGAKLRGRVRLAATEAEKGDPNNRLVELRFPSYPGQTEAEQQAAAIVALVGARPDPVVGAKADDAELAAVTARVQKRLPAVADAFRNGLPLGERIVVKAPFQADDGQVEWMWVGVTGWPGSVVRGNLENEPELVKSLHDGARVEVKQASIADFVWFAADGTKKEGGESAAILMRRRGSEHP